MKDSEELTEVWIRYCIFTKNFMCGERLSFIQFDQPKYYKVKIHPVFSLVSGFLLSVLNYAAIGVQFKDTRRKKNKKKIAPHDLDLV